MEKIVFYHTETCPMCKLLEQKLKNSKIQYEEVVDVEAMLDIGIKHVPVLKVEENYFNLKEALRWIDEYTGEN